MKRFFLWIAVLSAVSHVCAQEAYRAQRRSVFEVLPAGRSDIVFVGNSITDNCEWAELLADRRVKNRGIGTDRAQWLNERIDPIVAGHPRKLFLMIGTNDLAAGRMPREIAADIERAIDRIQAGSRRTKIFLQSILPVNGRAFGKFPKHYARADAIVETNRLLKALCAEKNIVYVDVYASLVDANGDLDAAYTNDGLHLMGEGYLIWRDVLKPYVQ